MPKPPVIKCPKCGYLPNVAGDTCLKCGTRLEKACGECGFSNSLEKNYCDQCGSELNVKKAEQPAAPAPDKPAHPKLEMESIQDTVNSKGASFRGKPPAAAPSKPPEKSAPGLPKVSSPMMADSARLRGSARVTPPPPSLAKRLVGPVVTGLLAVVLLSILYMIMAPSLPKFRLTLAAKAYLSAISQGRFEKAYELLSTNSRAACTQDDYVRNNKEYYSTAPAWQFKEVQVFAMDKDAAVVRYQLKEGTAPWKTDYISFVREHGRWTRPYIWIMFQPIQDALDRNDFPQALFLSQKLYLTDPLDPRTSGYLCSSEFFMKLYEKSAESCKRTVDAQAVYPVGYSNPELFWFAFYYADSLRLLGRDRVAVQEYEKLLGWPGVTAAEQCPVFLNRADSYVNLKEYDSALRDVMTAGSICAQEPAKSDAAKRLSFMSGAAGPAAIDFAQKARFQQGMPPIGEARRQQLEAMKARLGRGARLPRDKWLAVHTAGPEYRVFLRQEAYNPQTRKNETQDIFIFLVNLWTSKGKVEKAPVPPPPPAAPSKVSE